MGYKLHMRLTLLTVLPLMLLAACASPNDRSHAFADSTWTFTSIDGVTPASETARLRFENDRIGANVGCNGMGGPWRLEGDRLIAGPLVQTEMYCEGEVWGQEKAIGAMLVGAPVLELEGDRLTLKSSGHTAELRRTS